MMAYFTDQAAYREWRRASVAWFEWHVGDQRNTLGLKPKMVIPVAAVAMFLVAFHWPADGNFGEFFHKFSPTTFANTAAPPSDWVDPCPHGCKMGAVPESGMIDGPRLDASNTPADKTPPERQPWVILVGVGGTVLTLIMPFMLIYRIRRFVMRKPRRAAAVQHSEPEREREPHRAPMPARPLPVTMPELTPNLDDAVVRRFDRNVQQRLAELELARAPAAAIESRPPVSRGFGRKPV